MVNFYQRKFFPKIILKNIFNFFQKAAFVYPTALDKGIIMSWKSPKLYEFFIKGINALSKEIDFIGWDECLDFQFFEAKKMCVCCIKSEGSISEIFTLNLEDYTTINTAIKVRVKEDALRLVRSQGDNLYLKTNHKEITIYFDIDTKMRGKILRIHGFLGNEIVDFLPVGLNRMIVVTLDGNLGYHEFNEKDAVFGRISEKFELDLIDRERCNCITVCPYGKFAAVSTILTEHGKDLLSRLFFLEITKDNHFEILEIVDYSATEYGKEDGSYFSCLSLEFYHGQYPLLLALQRSSKNLLFSYTFRGTLNEYNEHYELHNSSCLMMKFFKNTLTSIDETGVISKIKFVKKEKSKKISRFNLKPIDEDLRNSLLGEDGKRKKKIKLNKSTTGLKNKRRKGGKRSSRERLQMMDSGKSYISKSLGNVREAKLKNKYDLTEDHYIDPDGVDFTRKKPSTLKSADIDNKKDIEEEDF